ncbi:MAG TPA: phospholipase C, phosphocholine-specific [Nevskiaceae bacterium]|nr:phospholipase C, phosphocholine-specific [Nevskiaceae bacterium]
MSQLSRRNFLRLAASAMGAASIPACIRDALAIPAAVGSGTIQDVEHVVILMQENRSFDHYFGLFPGVRGYGDRFPHPGPSGKPVWYQRDAKGQELLPYRLDASKGNAQRVSGTPHGWPDTHLAWNHGRMGFWPTLKQPQSMSHYSEAELPFQYALANAFTLCDDYHAAVLSSTNPNRLFMFTGTNDPSGFGGGPAVDNTNDDLGDPATGYTWTTYAERLEAAGVSWKVYQDMDDNFTDNSLEGFTSFRQAYNDDPSSPLVVKGLSSTLKNNSLDGLKNDVLAGKLPQVSWIVGPAEYSEHTGPSSPVQGAWYTQQVIEALIADPAVWSKTVLLVMFDENDGMFDHVPPPCAPSRRPDGTLAGASTLDDSTERYHDLKGTAPYSEGWVFGPGMRVPMYVISPWSRGGWVNSQTFDHTSIIRFLENRFGVFEPNISPWRRAMCGDLMSCFNFADPNDEQFPELPQMTKAEADQIRSDQEALPQIPAPAGADASMPQQPAGLRYSRPLPYELHASAQVSAGTVTLGFANTGAAGAVFHVYDVLHPGAIPRRYAVEAGKQVSDSWNTADDAGRYDLFVLGPAGFHRRFQGNALPVSAALPEVRVCYDVANGDMCLTLTNSGTADCVFTVTANAYRSDGPWTYTVAAGTQAQPIWPLADSARWYDFSVGCDADASFLRRVAGRVETGKPSFSDPAIGS